MLVMRAQRHQDGGPGPSFPASSDAVVVSGGIGPQQPLDLVYQEPSECPGPDIQLELEDVQAQLQRLRAAHVSAQVKLQAEREQSKLLHQALRGETQKVSRNKAAKLNAKASNTTD